MPAPSPAAAAAAVSNLRAARAEPVFYPDSDGRPMAENMWQSRAIMSAVGDIEAAHPRALVAADVLVYPEEGNSRNCIAPDVLVAFGLGTHSRRSYYVWAEGKPPDWVLEVASPSSKTADPNFKRSCYARMGVPEYWMFDAGALGRERDPRPERGATERGRPRLQGLKLAKGGYVPLRPRLVDGQRMIRSEVLGLDVRADGELLRFRDASGMDVRHRREVEADELQARMAVDLARAAVEREAAARSAAEARVAQLEAALRRRSRLDDLS